MFNCSSCTLQLCRRFKKLTYCNKFWSGFENTRLWTAVNSRTTDVVLMIRWQMNWKGIWKKAVVV